MPNIEYQYRQITLEEAQKISQTIKETPNITYYSAKKLVESKNVFVAEADKELAGVCILDEIGNNWWELKIVLVFESFRKIGIGLNLAKMGMNFLKKKNVNIFAISRNPTTINWLKDNNFETIDGWKEIPWFIKKGIIKSSFDPRKTFEYIRKSIKHGSISDWQYFIRYAK